jgi:hypothetical protein
MVFGISMIEWFGYGASIVVAVSLMMSSIVKLRWYNLAGAAMFSAYGFIIGALPVGFLNLFIALADIYYIVMMYREKEQLKIMEIKNEGDYLSYYLETHRNDIAKYFPNYKAENLKEKTAYYLLKNTVPVGVLLGRKEEDQTFCIELDYVGPQYRDFKMGDFIYNKSAFFKEMGYKKLTAECYSDEHKEYVVKMGFVKETENKYSKKI